MAQNPKVFGSFDLQYDTSEFERYRADLGYYNIDIMPECRVFIFGAEVSADVLSVNTNMTLNEISSCSISLANPRGRYTIQKADLCKKWREDKDILSAYNYDFFKKQFPGSYTDKVLKVAKSATTSIVGSGLFGTDPTVGKVTRKIFETKFYSGLVKHVGDVVFDYRDPVMIFFKGRFAPYWYFGFTGVIAGFDDANQFESDSIISINCESVLHMWKKQMIIKRSPLISAGLFEYQSTLRSAKNPETKKQWAYDIFNIEGTSGLSWNRFVQFVGWGIESYRSVGNNSLILNNIDKDTPLDITREQQSTDADTGKSTNNADESNLIDYYLWNSASMDKQNNISSKTLMRNAFAQCKMADGVSDIGAHLKSMCSTELINLNKGEHIPHPLGRGRLTKAGCNQSSDSDKVEFSAWQGLNLQYIKIAPKVFTKENELNKYFDASLRMWDKNPEIPTGKDNGDNSDTTTGWKDRQCFAIAGHHPAMTYRQISQFDFLTDIWVQIDNITKTSNGKDTKPIDRLIISPADKIREIVVGANTSYHCGDGVKQSSSTTVASPLGVDIYHMTYFRPRLFFIAPRRFNSGKSVDMSKFLNFNLTQAETTSCFDAIHDMCAKIDYCFYATQAGDIVIEPYMYDMQPTLFMDASQYKAYCTDPLASTDYNVKVSDPLLSNYGNTISVPTINFGERSNHPLSIMNKDLSKITQTFDSHQIATSTVVQTSYFNDKSTSVYQAQMEQAVNVFEMQQTIATLLKESGSKSTSSTVGIYIADGVNPHFFEKLRGADKNASIIYAENDLKQAVLNSLLNNYPSATLKRVLLSVAEACFAPAEFLSTDSNIPLIAEYSLDSFKGHNYLFDKYLSDLNDGDFSQGDASNSINYKNIGIYAKVLRSIYDYKMWAIKNTYYDDLLYSAAPLQMPEDTSNALTTYKAVSGTFSVFTVSDQSELSLQEVYTSCNTVYEAVTSSYSTIKSNLSSATDADTVAYLNVRLLEYISQLSVASAALELAKKEYIAGISYVWKNIDKLIYNDSSSNGRSQYEINVVQSFLSNIDSKLFAESNLVNSSNELKVIGFNSTTIAAILNKKSKDGYSITQMLMPGSNLQNKDTGVDWATEIYNNFLVIFRDYALLDADKGSDATLVTEVRRANDAYTTAVSLNSETKDVSIRTLADLKSLAEQGFYTPKRDLFRLYGYQPAPPKVFMYVDKQNKLDYAMMYLNQYIGQMYRLRIDIIGRPEMQLNRPHFVANKDCIGLSTNYSTAFNYGSDFNTAVTLNYIRKNSFSYAYSNDYLDAVGLASTSGSKLESVTGNTQALSCFANYYAVSHNISSAKKAIQAAEDTLVGGSLMTTDASQSVGIDVVTASALANSKYKNRGLHSIHDTIGHIDFDKKMIEEAASKNVSLSYSMVSIYDDAEIKEEIKLIDKHIENRETALALIMTLTKDKDDLIKKQDALNLTKTNIHNINLSTIKSNQILIGTTGERVSQFATSQNHGLNTSSISASIGLKLWSKVAITDKISIDLLNVDSLENIKVVFSFVSKLDKKTRYTTSLLTITKDTTWQDIVTAFSSMTNVNCEFIEEYRGVSAIKLVFSEESTYGTEIIVQSDKSSTDGWNTFDYLIPSQYSSEAISSVYNFALTNMNAAYTIDLVDKPIWKDLVSSISSVVNEVLLTPEIVITDNFIKIDIKNSKGIPISILDTNRGQSLIKALTSNGYDIILSNKYAAKQLNLNRSIDKSITNAAREVQAKTIEIGNITKVVEETSHFLFGFTDVSDTSSDAGVKKIRYNSSSEDINKVLPTWTVSFLESTGSDVAKSARGSLFGKLLLRIYEIKKSKAYQLRYIIPADRDKYKVLGNYSQEKVTEYAIKVEDITTIKSISSDVLKKYVWYSSTDSAKNKANADASVVFSQGMPTVDQYNKFDRLFLAEKYTESKNYAFSPTADGLGKFPIFVSANSARNKIESFLSDWKASFASNANIGISVLGYTSIERPDKSGPEFNTNLATRRASLIQKLLIIGKDGRASGDYVDKDRFAPVLAFGEDPLYRKVKTETLSNIQPDNRRVEIEIKNLQTVPLDYTVWEDWNTK